VNGTATVAFDGAKLRTLTETLEKRIDDVMTTLDASIADIEAGAFDPRLSSWLHWVIDVRRVTGVTIAIAGERAAERVASYAAAPASPAVTLVAADAPPGDAFALGTLRRDCAGLIWVGSADELAPPWGDLFGDSPLGVYCTRPSAGAPRGEGPWWTVTLPGRYAAVAELVGALVPEPAIPALAALAHARAVIDLVAGTQAEHARENARLVQQAALADRGKASHAIADELIAKRELTTQLRDDLNRDLQGSLDRLARVVAETDSELSFRAPVKRAMDEVPALATAPGKPVSVHEFAEEDRFHWWSGTHWERYQGMFPKKMRLTLRTADLEKISADLTAQVCAIVSKQSLRIIDGFDDSVADFAAVAQPAGVDLSPAVITPEERAHWDRKATVAVSLYSGSFGAGTATLAERGKRAVDASLEKDLRAFHVDIERKGPIGRIMEARTAVMGLSFLAMTGIRVSGAWGSIEQWMAQQAHPNAPAASGGIPWSLIFNAALVGVFFIFLGLIVNAITESGKEGAQISEKVHEARDALAEKLASVLERFVTVEMGELKALLGERKAAALERVDRALDAQKQELDEIERKGRGSGGLRTTRPGLAGLPIGLRSDLDKTTIAVRDLRAEVVARYAAIAAPPAAATVASPPAAASPAPAATVRAAPPPERVAALDALAARMAARAAAKEAGA